MRLRKISIAVVNACATQRQTNTSSAVAVNVATGAARCRSGAYSRSIGCSSVYCILRDSTRSGSGSTTQCIVQCVVFLILEMDVLLIPHVQAGEM